MKTILISGRKLDDYLNVSQREFTEAYAKACQNLTGPDSAQLLERWGQLAVQWNEVQGRGRNIVVTTNYDEALQRLRESDTTSMLVYSLFDGNDTTTDSPISRRWISGFIRDNESLLEGTVTVIAADPKNLKDTEDDMVREAVIDNLYSRPPSGTMFTTMMELTALLKLNDEICADPQRYLNAIAQTRPYLGVNAESEYLSKKAA